MTLWMIDPLERFAPSTRWREWLGKLRSMPQDQDILDAISEAETWIPKREQYERELAAQQAA
ncbi:hypothetical protein AGMMS49545_09090 [Betaproteobacteria bacterium]|nr:hypothetical protein AGMMS49545_09090 [Betaproteobacteria bacterium]GHU44005.1 hypothetical protein AGMMS50289_11430 [Betaproteobacteria bacterium]